MDGGESGGVEADAERQGQDSDDRKKWAFHQHAKTVLQVFDYVTDHDYLDSRCVYVTWAYKRLASCLEVVRAGSLIGLRHLVNTKTANPRSKVC